MSELVAPCGCKPGYHCDEAARLWVEMVKTYDQSKFDGGDEFQKANARHSEHLHMIFNAWRQQYMNEQEALF